MADLSHYKPHPIADIFPLLEGEAFVALKQDIRANGLHHPIVILDGMILDGRNRFRACQDVGVPVQSVEYAGGNPWRFAWSQNGARRHFANQVQQYACYQRVEAGAAEFERIEAETQTRANQARSEKAKAQHQASNPRKGETFGPVTSGDDTKRDHKTENASRSSTAQAALAGVGRKAVEQYGYIERHAPDKVADVLTQPSVTTILKEIEKEKNRASRAANAALKADSPTTVSASRKYRCIVIDPPWEMTKIGRNERPNQIGFDYPTMNESELAAFGVGDLADYDCQLFCWTTHKHLPTALRLLDAWGFQYTCAFVWHKAGGFQPYNLPQFNCEFVLYGRKGDPQFIETKQFFTCFDATRREHSRKPDFFFDTIRRVCEGPRIEVFARELRDGFDVFGNETGKFI